MTQPLINLTVAFPRNFNSEFHKWMDGQSVCEFLPLGIYQFYPDYIRIIDKRMHVYGECGAVIKLGEIETSHCYEKFFKDLNKGSCI